MEQLLNHDFTQIHVQIQLYYESLKYIIIGKQTQFTLSNFRLGGYKS